MTAQQPQAVGVQFLKILTLHLMSHRQSQTTPLLVVAQLTRISSSETCTAIFPLLSGKVSGILHIVHTHIFSLLGGIACRPPFGGKSPWKPQRYEWFKIVHPKEEKGDANA